jgi:hypothetical protein
MISDQGHWSVRSPRLLIMDMPSPKRAKAQLLGSMVDCQVEASGQLSAIVEDLLTTSETFPPDPRRVILVSGCRRAMQTAEVIATLAANQFVEDMAVLSRTLAETVINICYLQVCDEKEFRRLMIFDPISDLKLHRELKSAIGYSPSPEAEMLLEKMAQQALSTGLFGKKPRSWTEVPLAERARLSDGGIDARFNQQCMQILRTSVYQHGHTFVHFTRRGLGHFAAAYLKSGAFTEDQRLMQVLVMVGAANHALMGLATFLMSYYKLPIHEEWDGVNELLHTMKFGIETTDLSPPD